jgi:negative regulator of flagellin synthesis FlgM
MKIHLQRLMTNNPYKSQQQKQLEIKQDQQKQRDKVEISPAAKEMQASKGVHPERLDKVNQIKRQVETGTYQVRPQDVAQKMTQFFK